jgi:hypothetical protein
MVVLPVGHQSNAEEQMTALARQLPVYPWVKSVRGAAALGLATIVAEAGGPLDPFANPAKLWSRLGFAPYSGHAGSTWKRGQPRALTKAEWIAHPFSGERYAMIIQIGLWLRNKQWIGKKKTASGQGEPNRPYGAIYAARRAHTAVTHPDWSDGHADRDALRVMTKAYLLDLWCA